jgi:hypothetical protein
VEGNQFGQLGVHHIPQAALEVTEEPTILILNNGLWYTKVNPNMLK